MQDLLCDPCEIHSEPETWYLRPKVEDEAMWKHHVYPQRFHVYTHKIYRMRPRRKLSTLANEIARRARREQISRERDSRGSTPQGLLLAITRMIELLELPPGWNSYSAKPIKKENVNFAIDLLNRLMRPETPAPHVIPTARGGVQLEWHQGGIDIEITISSPDNASFVAEDRTGKQNPAEGALDRTALLGWMERLSE